MANETSGGSSTKQLKHVLGFGDLMGVAVGQIIGAGIMTLLGEAIGMTGRSVPIAFIIAAVITILQYLPLLLIAGTVRVRGGQYTMVAMMVGEKMAGAYTIIYMFSNIAFPVYALSFASYFFFIFGFGNEKIIAIVLLTIFFGLNVFGIDKFAKIENVVVIFLVIALGLFAAFGVPNIAPGYIAENSWMTGGVKGLLQASGLLTFAVGGGSMIVNLSAEAKNPTRDIPVVMIVSTLVVSAVYALLAIVAAGVLPVEEVAGANLAAVASVILPRPLYIFFMVCGACFALISTLNAEIAWVPKPILQCCDDGWLPAGFGKLSKWKTPVNIMAFYYVISVGCVLSGVSISSLYDMCLVATGVVTLLVNMFVWKLPSWYPRNGLPLSSKSVRAF